MRTLTGKLVTVMAAVIGAGSGVGLFVRPVLVPWLLASLLFLVNLGLSLVFFRLLARFSPAAAAGLALLSLALRLGLVALGLLLAGWLLPAYFAATAVSFLVVYTLFVGLEIVMGLKLRPGTGAPVSGGGA